MQPETLLAGDIATHAVAKNCDHWIPSYRWREVGLAIATVRPGQILAAEEILVHCAVNVMLFECPRLIEFVYALPRNVAEKTHKLTPKVDFQ
jgi:fatty-acyl-CoA synthase